MSQSENLIRPSQAQSASIIRPADTSGVDAGGGVQVDGTAMDIADANGAGGDPSSLGVTWSQLFDDITVTVAQDTIANTPEAAAYLPFDVINSVTGEISLIQMTDLLQSIIRLDSLVPVTDRWIGFQILNTTSNNGFAVRLAAVAGDWQVQHSVSAGGTFGAWVISASDTDTQGLLFKWGGRGSGGTQIRANAIAINGAGVDQGGTTSTATTTGSNVGGDINEIRLLVGNVAGGLATEPSSVTFRVGYFLASLLDFPALASFF